MRVSTNALLHHRNGSTIHLLNNFAVDAGEKFNHECAFVIRFKLEGEITVLRAYYDLAHMNEHVEDNKNEATHN